MSIALPVTRSLFLKETLRRGLSSSRILIKARVIGSKIQDTFSWPINKLNKQSDNIIIRSCTNCVSFFI